MPKIKNLRVLEQYITVPDYTKLTGKSTFKIHEMIDSGMLRSISVSGTKLIPFQNGTDIARRMEKTSFVEIDNEYNVSEYISFKKNDNKLKQFLFELCDALLEINANIEFVYWTIKENSVVIDSIWVQGENIPTHDEKYTLPNGYLTSISEKINTVFEQFGIEKNTKDFLGGNGNEKHGGFIITAKE